jgi:ABC-type multidrug transport system ATPase subunit
MTTAIEAHGLTKRFGKTQALAGIDLEVAEGRVLGVLGPNGAGKTTAVRILATLLRPDEGTARVAGTTVLLTTHYMEEAEQLCDRIAIMDHGQVIACDTPRALIADLGAEATVRAVIEGAALSLPELRALAGVVEAELSASEGRESLELRTKDTQATLIDLLELTRARGVTLSGLGASQATLEDVFLVRTGHRYEGNGVMGGG